MKQLVEDSWTAKYWDTLHQLYWWPRYIGLGSIPRKRWSVARETVSVPKDLVNPAGPLYRRVLPEREYWRYIRRQEETFNHIFSLALAIVPGDVLCDIFFPQVRFEGNHFFHSLGQELWSRYSWDPKANVTVPDGYFVADGAILAVELKFKAKTSWSQLAKYLMLYVSEELRSGPKKELSLLYIYPAKPTLAFEAQVGVSPSLVSADLFEPLLRSVRNQHVRRHIEVHEEGYRNVLDRLSVACISWQEFRDSLSDFSDRLATEGGDRTLKRLIDGLVVEIENHPLSKVNSAHR